MEIAIIIDKELFTSDPEELPNIYDSHLVVLRDGTLRIAFHVDGNWWIGDGDPLNHTDHGPLDVVAWARKRVR